MLRGRPQPEPAAAQPPVAGALDGGELDGIEKPYGTGERPAGILFVRGPKSRWLPYHLLQGMRYEAGRVTLEFASADVLIEGRGLHGLFLDLARQVVERIVEQGERYAEVSDAATWINRIVEIPKGTEGRQGDGGADG